MPFPQKAPMHTLYLQHGIRALGKRLISTNNAQLIFSLLSHLPSQKLRAHIFHSFSSVFSKMESRHNSRKATPSLTINTNVLQLASHLVTIKHTVEKYLLWKVQTVLFLKGNQLQSHVDGTSSKPPSIDGQLNPKFIKWVLLDQLVIFALNSSFLDFILAQVLDCESSHQVLTTLQDLFFSHSSPHAYAILAGHIEEGC